MAKTTKSSSLLRTLKEILAAVNDSSTAEEFSILLLSDTSADEGAKLRKQLAKHMPKLKNQNDLLMHFSAHVSQFAPGRFILTVLPYTLTDGLQSKIEFGMPSPLCEIEVKSFDEYRTIIGATRIVTHNTKDVKNGTGDFYVMFKDVTHEEEND